MTEAEGACGDGAEAYARGKAATAQHAGNLQDAEVWEIAANYLHTLHSANRRWVRPGQAGEPPRPI